jgi:hypothetical protein
VSALEQQTTPMLRWSSVRDCPRKAVYEATGAPARERTLNEERTLYRGKSVGREFAIFLAARERAKGKQPWRIFVASGVIGEWPRRYLTSDRAKAAFIVEEAVPWPLGILHPDIRVVETNTIVEVLSSAHASEDVRHSKMLQLVGQIEYTGANGGAVVVVDPTNLSDEIFPLAKTSKLYGELLEEMRDRVAQVQAWADTGAVPDRVCRSRPNARTATSASTPSTASRLGAAPPTSSVDPTSAVAAADVYQAKQAELARKENVRRRRRASAKRRSSGSPTSSRRPRGRRREEGQDRRDRGQPDRRRDHQDARVKEGARRRHVDDAHDELFASSSR